jgi:peptidoglycan/LPS O-acetylase OafA/YrhL
MQKLIFAQQLRGIAALLVVITHYFGIYYGAQGVVATITASPELHLVAPAWVAYMDFPYFKGPFGVAVFFLISGFVIPFSLQKQRGARFLLARGLRIYPTYIACLTLGLLAVLLSAHYWQQPYTVDWQRIAANALLLHNLVNLNSYDAINWTLAIELKFYLLAALCAPALVQRKPAVLALIAAAIIGLGLLPPHAAALQPFLGALSSDLNYVPFMLIGVLFYQHYQRLLSSAGLVGGALLLLGAFLLAWRIGPQGDQVPVLAEYYIYAVVVFGACYALRERFRSLRLLDFLADISYPLYAVHPLVGYVMLKILMQQGLSFGLAVCLTLASAIGLAWLLHIVIEKPSNALGKKLATSLTSKAN